MKNFDDDIINSLIALETSGIILYPTDTIWGIGCDATNENAVKKIYRLKKREEQKSMIILVADTNDIEHHVLNPSEKIIDFLSKQQKPTTAIFKGAVNLPASLVNVDGSIAIRIVQDEFCKDLIKRFRKPIVSTSANVSGNKSPKNFYEIEDVIKNGVDYIVNHRQHETGKREPSSIIKLDENGAIEKIR